MFLVTKEEGKCVCVPLKLPNPGSTVFQGLTVNLSISEEIRGNLRREVSTHIHPLNIYKMSTIYIFLSLNIANKNIITRLA